MTTTTPIHLAGASVMDRRPVAAVTLPRGVPAGFRGSWIEDN